MTFSRLLYPKLRPCPIIRCLILNGQGGQRSGSLHCRCAGGDKGKTSDGWQVNSAKQMILALLLLAIAGGGWYMLQTRLNDGAAPKVTDKTRQSRPVIVDAAPAQRLAFAERVSAIGTTAARQAVTLRAKVTGIVTDILFRDGEKVPAGKVLLKLDDREVLSELAEAQARLRNARQLLERALKLKRSRNIPQARVDELAAQEAIEKAAMERIRTRLRDYTIRAPFAGRLGLSEIGHGALLRPGDAITTLDDAGTVKLRFDVPETLLAGLRTGLNFTARSVAYPDKRFSGTITAIDSRIDPVTRAIAVLGEIDNRDGVLRPGMFMSVEMTLGEKRPGIFVPETAVLLSTGGTYLFVIRDGRARRIAVRTGRRRGHLVEVSPGPKEGEMVVTAGGDRLRDGRPVTIRKPEGDAAATAAPNGKSGQ